MALDTLTRDEWGLIWHESPRVGWCLVEPRAGYTPPASSLPRDMVNAPAGHAILLPTGHVTIEQLGAVLHTLPVDLTFVDADDRVAFYSEGPERIFSRSRAVIGRKVQHCHPPRSVAIVDRILDDFRAGRQSTAEFWIEMHGRFVHIRYFAVRNTEAEYMGCLEMTQDVTKIRALQGERRLLAYEGDQAPAAARETQAGSAAHAAAPPSTAAPLVNAALIVRTIDADEMLATGTHPLHARAGGRGSPASRPGPGRRQQLRATAPDRPAPERRLRRHDDQGARRAPPHRRAPPRMRRGGPHGGAAPTPVNEPRHPFTAPHGRHDSVVRRRG